MTKSPKRAGSYTLGRGGFAKISAVEGLRPSRRMESDFREFDRKGLSAEERRRELTGKYVPKG
ncbi:MAG TPA: hypothetical protein VIJ79_15030 [Acidobacteriaceae bacterium]